MGSGPQSEKADDDDVGDEDAFDMMGPEVDEHR
jgi:hypothetical protein